MIAKNILGVLVLIWKIIYHLQALIIYLLVKIFLKKFGTYIDSSGVPKQGNKNYTVMKIKCDLANDATGKDLSEFRKAFSRL